MRSEEVGTRNIDVLSSSSTSEEDNAVLGSVMAAVEMVCSEVTSENGRCGSRKERRSNLGRGACSWWNDYLA